MFGLKLSVETRAKLAAAQKDKYKKIEGIDIQKNITTRYESMKAAASALGIRISSLSVYFKNNQKNLTKADIFLTKYRMLKLRNNMKRHVNIRIYYLLYN